MNLNCSIEAIDGGLLLKVPQYDEFFEGLKLIYIDKESSEYEKYLLIMGGKE